MAINGQDPMDGDEVRAALEVSCTIAVAVGMLMEYNNASSTEGLELLHAMAISSKISVPDAAWVVMTTAPMGRP
ncbi:MULTISPECIES: ANTAR domain-containing protein [Actinomycetes]|uniref:ANTAR domain-containing protein n=1 Tax=Williamsia marianensis TaxID=85044 RepID=A0ABU4F021_WILMA|nr:MULTISPECIES: ANTAR domain-containing protein [Actinomycetes]MCK0515888.1 ANTAR domain-containing protein [Williamsia sp. DF01-3]MDV7136846.1 ANTAR domain-containing protein [Williamsia muralis]PVY25135.1 hypothetical protein C7458_11826 [Williamsia marianensis]